MSHDRTVKPIVDRGKSHGSSYEIQKQNSENELIRTLLDRQKEQILADCQAEIRKHEFQLSETIESKQEELHRAQAEDKIINFFMNSF